MIIAINWLKSFLFPFHSEIKEIESELQNQKEKACINNSKIEAMMATLNGEDTWFLERKNGTRRE